MEAVHRILGSQKEPLTLSPVGDVWRPTWLKLSSSQSYRRLLSDLVLKHTPGSRRHKGLFNRFLNRSSILKMEADAARGYDISVVLYPASIRVLTHGIVVDHVGRIYNATSNGKDIPDLEYVAGRFNTKSSWIAKEGTRIIDRRDHMRYFYSMIRRIADNRIRVAGTVGFGLWDSIWMSFNFSKARTMLLEDPSFVHKVFGHWAKCPCMAADAMLNARIKLVFLRENPNGFPTGGGLAESLHPLVSEYYKHICESVHARGGCVILDCDADDMIETGLPVRWGFDGIGPVRFRDTEDLKAARKAIDQRLYLIGSLAVPIELEGKSGTGKRPTGFMLTSKSKWKAQPAVDDPDLSSEYSLLLDKSGDSPTK